jgi:hypothetical protein
MSAIEQPASSSVWAIVGARPLAERMDDGIPCSASVTPSDATHADPLNPDVSRARIFMSAGRKLDKVNG